MGHRCKITLTEAEACAVLRVVDCGGIKLTSAEERVCAKIRAAMKRPASKASK